MGRGSGDVLRIPEAGAASAWRVAGQGQLLFRTHQPWPGAGAGAAAAGHGVRGRGGAKLAGGGAAAHQQRAEFFLHMRGRPCRKQPGLPHLRVQGVHWHHQGLPRRGAR